jgi:predicted  nucleic acid-binding Zn-ribbon protein
MNEDPTKELPQRRSFEEQVLAEFAALRSEVAALRSEVAVLGSDVATLGSDVATLGREVAALRSDVAEIRAQQSAMAKNIAGIDKRLTLLEETVDARLKETRPIWEAVQAQIEKLDQKFDIVIRDLYDVRGDMALHAKRISQLEHAISS